MKKMTFSAIAAALIAAPALAGAQSPSPSPQTPPSQTPPPATSPAPSADRAAARADKVKGELVKVDAEAKKITIKDATGLETSFAYSDATEVTGGQAGVAGLATKSGAKVTVHFKTEAGAKTATKIEVDDKM
jgi:hypothetical protein